MLVPQIQGRECLVVRRMYHLEAKRVSLGARGGSKGSSSTWAWGRRVLRRVARRLVQGPAEHCGRDEVRVLGDISKSQL